jgi:hypothetical protein
MTDTVANPRVAISAVLRRAAELIAKPENWIKGHLAQDRMRKPVPDTDPAACRFCINGAIGAAAAELGVVQWPAMVALDRTLKSCRTSRPHDRIVHFNDLPETTHAQALDLLKRAAEEQARLEGIAS